MVSMHGCAELAELDLVDIDTSAVESNIVLWHLKPEAPAVAVVLQRLKDAGFLVGGMKSAQLPPLWFVSSVLHSLWRRECKGAGHGLCCSRAAEVVSCWQRMEHTCLWMPERK